MKLFFSQLLWFLFLPFYALEVAVASAIVYVMLLFGASYEFMPDDLLEALLFPPFPQPDPYDAFCVDEQPSSPTYWTSVTINGLDIKVGAYIDQPTGVTRVFSFDYPEIYGQGKNFAQARFDFYLSYQTFLGSNALVHSDGNCLPLEV